MNYRRAFIPGGSFFFTVVTESKQALWQHRYWEHAIRDDMDYRRHVEYIHYNPVKHGYVKSAKDWEHSSFHRYVGEGSYPQDWGAGEKDFEGIGHE